MSITNLGKKNHKVIRVSGTGDYIDGEYLESPEVELFIRANIQPAMSSFRTQLLPEGDRNKEAIAIYSNDWLYTARSGTHINGVNNTLPCDLIVYRGAKWEVVVARPYGNFGEHCEALAIKLNDSNIERINGDIENII